MTPQEVVALATDNLIVYLVETREDGQCPNGGVCVTRVIGPAVTMAEKIALEELRARLVAEGRWIHYQRVSNLDWPEVTHG